MKKFYQIRAMKKKPSSGFTLMELMVVIAIIGIMAGMAVPWMLNPEHRVKKVARELIGDMQQTKMSAVKQNHPWRIVFNVANNSYTIVDGGDDADNDGNIFGDSDDRNVKTVPFTNYAEGVVYQDGCGGGNTVSYNSNILTFNPQGTCNAGYAYIQYKDASYRVGTLSTGIIRIQSCVGGTWQ